MQENHPRIKREGPRDKEAVGRNWLVFALLAALLFLPVSALRRSKFPSSDPDARLRATVRLIDLNRALEAELCLIPGIGPTRAAAIIRYREEQGPYPNLRGLENVKGLGPGTTSRMAGWVLADGSGNLPAPMEGWKKDGDGERSKR